MKHSVRKAIKKKRFRKVCSRRKLSLNIVSGKQTDIAFESQSYRMPKPKRNYKRDKTRRLITNKRCNSRQQSTSSSLNYRHSNTNTSILNYSKPRKFKNSLSARCALLPNTSIPISQTTCRQSNSKWCYVNNSYNKLPKFSMIQQGTLLSDKDVLYLDSSMSDNFVASAKPKDTSIITINDTFTVNSSGSVPDLSKFSIPVTPDPTKTSEGNEDDSIICIDSDKPKMEWSNVTLDQKTNVNESVITVDDETDNDDCLIISPLPFCRLKISERKRNRRLIHKKKEKIKKVNHIFSTAIPTRKLITLLDPMVPGSLITKASSKGKTSSNSSTNIQDIVGNSAGKTYSNVYSSECIEKNGLREIIIDGSNVALGHTNGELFSVEGLQIVIDYFVKRGHKVRAFVPKFRLAPSRCSNPELLLQLVNDKHVILTPSRAIKGKRITPYDDRFIIQYASLCEGIVVSSDCYRDLIDENQEWRNTIENRLLMPTWIDNVLMFPQDPLGRFGPSLTDFLKFPVQ